VGTKPSVFISYTGPQRLWAKWVRNELLAIDFDVEMDVEDWKIGEGLISRINEALSTHKFFLALWSKDYFSTEHWTVNEIDAAYSLYRQNLLVIIPFYIESGYIAPPLYQSLISSNLYGLTENAARFEFRSRLEPYANRSLKTLPSPRTSVQFPGSILSSQNSELKIESTTKAALLKMADEKARKVLSPQLPETVNAYALEDIANQLRVLSRSYNAEPPSRVLENTLQLWGDLDIAEVSASHDPKRLIDVLVMKSRAFGLQSYATMDMGDTKSAFRNAVAMKFFAEKANHEELAAWALGTQALILRLDKQFERALPLIDEGLRLPISGMARSRLYCQAVLSWAEIGNLDTILSLLEESEKSIDKRPGSSDEADGIFFFSRAKHHYYAGNALMRSYFDQAKRAEKETRLALTLFAEGDDDTKSVSDELIASIHLAISISNQGRIDEILETLQPVIAADPEYRTAWHLRWLQRLEIGLKARKRYGNSEFAAKLYEVIQKYEHSLKS
jgi:tetratricopeptide (TPR) repeat protein